MLNKDSYEVEVLVKHDSKFPNNTKGKIIASRFIDGTSIRAYLIQTDETIEGLSEGLKTEWYLERDLINLKEE